jgi:hypothetical protein
MLSAASPWQLAQDWAAEPAALDPQQTGIGEIIILQPLVLFREIGIARAPAIDDVAA